MGNDRTRCAAPKRARARTLAEFAANIAILDDEALDVVDEVIARQIDAGHLRPDRNDESLDERLDRQEEQLERIERLIDALLAGIGG